MSWGALAKLVAPSTEPRVRRTRPYRQTWELSTGEHLCTSQLHADARNVHQHSDATLRERCYRTANAAERTPELIWGPSPDKMLIRTQTPHGIEVLTSWQLYQDVRNVHKVSNTAIYKRAQRGDRDIKRLLRKPYA